MKLCDVCKSNRRAIEIDWQTICRVCGVKMALNKTNDNYISLMEMTEKTFIANETEYTQEMVANEVKDKIETMEDDELEMFLNGEGW